MKSKILTIATCLTLGGFANAQNVNIPDTNFRNALLAHGTTITGTGVSTIDTNGDGEIQVTEAQAYSGEIHVNNMGIKSVTGIEAFTNLYKFHGMDNNITSIDLSQNTSLYHVSLTRNQLTSIDLSQNDNLGWAYCDSNNLVYANAHNLTNGYGGSVFNFRGNPLLTCIEVENGTAPHMFWAKDATASWSANCNIPCIVHIPDSTFKAILVGNTAINTNGDTEIQCSEASAYTGTINVSNQTSIIELTGLEAFTNITELFCANIQLSSLDISANTALTGLYCNNNQLSSLDISSNTALMYLSCQYNQLPSLDVSTNTALSILSCNNNQLSTLDISANTGLMELFCNNTQITSLDVSANTFLTTLQCGNNNQLTSLNLANGNNGVVVYSNLYYVNATNNPNLICIQHDTGFDPATATNWTKDATASWSSVPCPTCYNIVNIPDANFKSALLDHGVGITFFGVSVIDTDGDGEICQTEAQAYTGSIHVYNQNISDLTGIEEFININFLDCSSNQLTNLDVSVNTALGQLNCNNNQLTSLNVANGNNTNLNYMHAQNNPNLNCIQHDTGFNPTTATSWQKDATASWSDNCPPVSSCANIVNIPDANFKNALLAHGTSITGTGISVIDTDGDGEICQTEAQNYTGRIDVSSKSISDLTGIETFVNATILQCQANQLSSLDVSANTALIHLYCNGNQISSLDVSANTALLRLNCNNNQLTNLNVANGNNGANPPNLFTVFAAYNPNLTCIQHDAGFDPTSAGFDPITFSGWTKDATASWSTNCSGSTCANIVNIPDANFKNALINHSPTIDTDGDGEICQTEAQAYTGVINVNSKSISDLTGIEAFVNATELLCISNQLTSVDVSANTALTGLNCSNNQLTSLDVSANTALTLLHCRNNQLISLDVSVNTALTELYCSGNPLTSLNVANGNNGASSSNLFYMRANGNPNLTCIQHDTGFDPTTATDWYKDATASWSDNCSNSGGGTSSINENNISFSIVPNPTSGMVKIETDVEINSIEVFSMTGQKIQSSTEKTIDLSEVKSGVYFVKVLSDGGSFTARIIKE